MIKMKILLNEKVTADWRWKKKWVSELEEKSVEMIQLEEQSLK